MWLVKLAYDGSRFFGSQIQPDVPTVGGEITRVLRESGTGGPPKFASRTDPGVSARCNAFCYRGNEPRLRQMNSMMDGIYCWAYAEVQDGFNVRAVKGKEYRYFLVKDYGIKAMKEGAKLFEGEHDFRNFSRAKADTVRSMDRLRVTKKFVSFRAQGFLWEQLRRIMTVLIAIGEGRLEPKDVTRLLHDKRGVHPAPAEGLVLWDLDYGIRFKSQKTDFVHWDREMQHAIAIREIAESLKV